MDKEYVIYIENAQGSAVSDWFHGPGWYFITEDFGLDGPYNKKEHALTAQEDYFNSL